MRAPLLAALGLAPLAAATLLGAAEPAAQVAPPTPAPTLAPAERTAILQKTATLRLAPDLAHLTPGERAAVNHLLQVGGILQRLYEEARHPEAERERLLLLDEARSPAAAGTPGALAESDAARLFRLFQGPIATTLDNRRVPFLAVAAETPGKNVYPAGITAAEVETFLAAHPAERPSILGERTVVRRATAEALAADLDTLQRVPLVAGLHPFLVGKLAALAEHPDPQVLYAVPQAVAWARPLTTAYLSLLHAADAVAADDAEFAGYLRNRARDLLSNDYESGDAAWVTGRFGRLNAQIGSYETYDDALFGVKAFPSMSLLLRDEAATAELAKSLGSLQEIEDALPYSPKKRVRPEIPIGVYEVIADFGQARGTEHGDEPPERPAVLAPLRPHHPDARQHHEEPRSLRQRAEALERGDRARPPAAGWPPTAAVAASSARSGTRSGTTWDPSGRATGVSSIRRSPAGPMRSRR